MIKKRIPYRVVKTQELSKLRKHAQRLVEQIDSARRFIKEIESGNLDIEIKFDGQDDDNALAMSLVSMRDQMRRISSEEKQRNWATEGLAKFVDILRSNNDDLSGLSQLIISNIVKYTAANQGSLYIMNQEGNDSYLDLVGCYAYDRKKHREQRISLGEGLVGQCALEKDTLYMTNLPADYLKITSGLGQALPKNLLIVPLLLNNTVYGAIELASFTKFEQYHRDFLEKLAESIASTISNVKVNEQTRKLLHETQVQTEQVRSQEEEMRQNMEELSATQEEMQRVLREVEGKEAYVTQLLNLSTDSIYSVDKQYKLVSWNSSFAVTLERFGMRLEKGANTLDWFQGAERDAQVNRYRRALAGESFDFMTQSVMEGKTIHHLSVYAPLKNATGDVFEVAVFSKDMSEIVSAQQTAEKAARDAQNQTEELKAQEEELRQNMEELAATQDEMQRILNEVQSKEAYLKSLLNSSRDAIFTVDRELGLISFNDGFTVGLKQMGVEVDAGFNLLNIFPDEKQKNEQRANYARAFNGEAFEITSEFDMSGIKSYYSSNYSPLYNEKGEVFAVSVFGNDVTEIFTAKLNAERLAKEAQEKSEEVKAQEEELRQNMEELSSTQEEMERVMKEMEVRSRYTLDLLNASDDIICTIDRDYRLMTWNKTFEDFTKNTGGGVEKGFNTLEWYPKGDARNEHKKTYDRALKGEAFQFESTAEVAGQQYSVKTSYKPLRDEKGKTYEVAMFTRMTLLGADARTNSKKS
ncbi:PAS domain-containing protein [Chryseolinea sp. T2]|uniref:PAS domain-containing protein n=1 Tax=Chryseolinea sp. T2 TaxID=3129255 RepID=UPI0030770625